MTLRRRRCRLEGNRAAHGNLSVEFQAAEQAFAAGAASAHLDGRWWTRAEWDEVMREGWRLVRSLRAELGQPLTPEHEARLIARAGLRP